METSPVPLPIPSTHPSDKEFPTSRIPHPQRGMLLSTTRRGRRRSGARSPHIPTPLEMSRGCKMRWTRRRERVIRTRKPKPMGDSQPLEVVAEAARVTMRMTGRRLGITTRFHSASYNWLTAYSARVRQPSSPAVLISPAGRLTPQATMLKVAGGFSIPTLLPHRQQDALAGCIPARSGGNAGGY